MLVVVVTPYSAYCRNCGSRGAGPTWPWPLIMPGVTNLPERSVTFAPFGTDTCGPISRMRPFSITIVTPACGADPVPSIRVAFFRTVIWAEAEPVTKAATARTNAAVRMLVLLDGFPIQQSEV